MNAKLITIDKGFITLKDFSICIFFSERNEKYEYLKTENTKKYDVYIFSYYNTFKQLMNLYVENFEITEVMDELHNEVYIYGKGSKTHFIDKKELTYIKRKSVVKNILGL